MVIQGWMPQKHTPSHTDGSTNNPTSWSWSFPGGNPSSSTDESPTGITYSTAGIYDVSLTATNGWGNDQVTKSEHITVEIPAGILFISRSEWKIFPNPNEGLFTLEVSEFDGDGLTFEIYNSLGQKVASQNLELIDGNQFPVDLRKYPSGGYTAKLISDNTTDSKSLIIE